MPRLSALAAAAALAASASAASPYHLIVDAGSTGSRLHVFEREGKAIHPTEGKKVKPGLSTLAETPATAAGYIRPLFEDAAKTVPAASRPSTPVHVFATAGMRLVPAAQQEDIWDSVAHSDLSDLGFELRRENLATISGADEGYYGALSANYLTGLIDATRSRVGVSPADCDDPSALKPLMGALDLGGSSTQITYPQSSAAGCPSPRKHDFWTHSYLSYGAEKIRERLWSMLNAKGDGSNPCDLKGHAEEWEGKTLQGTGDAAQCAAALETLVFGEGKYAERCHPGSPCHIEGISMPPPPKDSTFVAMSVYFFALNSLRLLSPSPLTQWPYPTADEVWESVEAFCKVEWTAETQAAWDGKDSYTDTAELPRRCLHGVYVHTLLTKVIGLPSSTRAVRVALEVDGTEVEWTLGAAIELGASGSGSSSGSPTTSAIDLALAGSEPRVYDLGSTVADRGSATAGAAVVGFGLVLVLLSFWSLLKRRCSKPARGLR